MKYKPRERDLSWPDWFKPKSYPHFDQPIRDPGQIRDLVESPDQVARRAFLPFIRFEKNARKYKKQVQPNGVSVGGFKKKPRDLKYASHTDSQIFRHYTNELSKYYENTIATENISNSVLAYRRLDPGKCNIHFAAEAIEWIKQNAPCTALTFDVKDFFEALDHALLKKRWREVLGVSELPPDHYNIFKTLTRYAWVDRKAVLDEFGITTKKLKHWRQPICTPQEFRARVRQDGRNTSLIHRKTDNRGIPQGSPVSALLSNIYMIPVDKAMTSLADAHGALYRRYSDDILIICKSEHCGVLTQSLETETSAVNLTLHDSLDKRSVSNFVRVGGTALSCDRPLQYLGFSFDGDKVRIRSQTVAKFYRRMRKAVRREKYLARLNAEAGGDGRVRRKRLYSRYSHLGSRNFITGYDSAARKLFGDSAIRGQLKSHWQELHDALES